MNRRTFLKSAATAAAVGPWMITAARAAAPKLRHASIGAAGQALSDISSLAKHPLFDLVAVADVDLCRIEPLQRLFPNVRIYQDWRELLKREQSHIDSVNVSVPDHMHCLIAVEAMKRGKAVYVEKPLCNTVRETRLLTDFARKRGLPTQMGIQISSTKPQRYGEALVRSGIIGKIREVHTFSNKSWGDQSPIGEALDPVPASLNWDAWLGVSAARPFKRGAYHPGEWRRRIGFGTGTLGDMGCHIFSPPYRALKLTSPLSVTSYGPAPTAENWPTRARIKLTYPGTEYTTDAVSERTRANPRERSGDPAVTASERVGGSAGAKPPGSTVDVWWYDGGELPPDAIREPVGSRWPAQGSVVVGTDGTIVLPHMTADPFVLPDAKMRALPTIDLPERDHYKEFVDVVLAGGRDKCSADFSYSGPLTESVILGNVAAHFPSETLQFDARALAFTNKPEANQYLTRSYRSGWQVKT